MAERGMVYLVGAGPGNPGLITVRGLACLRRADVVVHDRLIHPQLLDEAPARAERINVGKAPGRHPCPQAEINVLLVAKARQGKTVVRLKGGDPFVFGRGGEECEALAAAGIPFEVIPGVTSAMAVPAYAGIPLTHRGYARDFAVVTGHCATPSLGGQARGRNDRGVDWEALARIDTLVILMGVENLTDIAAGLMAGGRAWDTPVASIEGGTDPRQRTIVGTLADIGDRARRAGLRPPAVTVVGEVVRLREYLRWFEESGCSVTQTADTPAAMDPISTATRRTTDGTRKSRQPNPH